MVSRKKAWDRITRPGGGVNVQAKRRDQQQKRLAGYRHAKCCKEIDHHTRIKFWTPQPAPHTLCRSFPPGVISLNRIALQVTLRASLYPAQGFRPPINFIEDCVCVENFHAFGVKITQALLIGEANQKPAASLTGLISCGRDLGGIIACPLRDARPAASSNLRVLF